MIIRRDKGSSLIKARKNDVSDYVIRSIKVLGLVTVITLGTLIIPNVPLGFANESTSSQSDETTQTVDADLTRSEKKKLTRTFNEASNNLRKKAHNYSHLRLKENAWYHKPVKNSGVLTKERKKYHIWRVIAKTEHREYLKFKNNVLRPCLQAGFPRWYCPDIISASWDENVSWYKDPDLAWIIKHESGFRPCVRNGGVVDCSYRGDRAWGLFQFLGSTWRGTGINRSADPYWQSRAGIRYIERRYGSPSGAKAFWLNNNFY